MQNFNNEFYSRFFKSVFYDTIIKENWGKIKGCSFTKFSKDNIYSLLADIFEEYNNQELTSHIDEMVRNFAGRTWNDSNMVDFFNVLFEFSDNMITRYENQYCFKFSYTNIWRNITRELGEELFVTAAVVMDDCRRRNTDRRYMDWPFCVEHDNNELKKMLRRDLGVSENHFHLRGSSPYFDVSWVILMNSVTNENYAKTMDEIDRNYLMRYNDRKLEFPMKLLWLKAASVRLLLYLSLSENFDIDDMYDYRAERDAISEAEKKNKKIEVKHPLKAAFCEIRDIIFDEVLPFDCDMFELFPIGKISDKISSLNTKGGLDYAASDCITENQKYSAFAGERYIIYRCLKKIYMRKEGYKITSQFLLLYLIMKHKFYIEMVQSNRRIGFENFEQYQKRKDWFIPDDDELEILIAADTIHSIIDNTKIYKAELRINPPSNSNILARYIHNYDTAINNALKNSENKYRLSCEQNFFYTLHFVKRSEQFCLKECRSYSTRKDIDMRARAIFGLRDFDVADRIYGIDACGLELNCRPEIFGPMFRYLQYYDTDIQKSDGTLFQQLKVTYHAGEDNYDLLDGLRAIDEAINFLEMRSGNRLGHATLLGIPPYEFYNSMKNPVSMPVQIMLDNFVWMFNFIIENEIDYDEISNLKTYINKKSEEMFNRIYLDAINSERINSVLEYSGYTDKNLRRETLKFNLDTYYLSYLLRGDEPELYRNGYYEDNNLSYSETYRICKGHERMKEARRSPEAAYLNYAYQYREDVYNNGKETITEKLPEFFIKGVEAVQRCLRQKISDEGIGIETNPTSNLFISSIKSYADHPISMFYNSGLVRDENDVQLNVSINTDDKSVFSTSLSNEYAYLLHALQNKKDSNGNKMYSRYDIMRWLDDIRRMGNEQSFAH